MKTVRVLKTKEILRLPDDEAQTMVTKGTAVFVPKHVWKGIRHDRAIRTDWGF